MTFYNPLVLPKIKRAMAQPIAPGVSVLATGGPKLGLARIPSDMTFSAPLTINTMDYASRVQQTFSRSSAAVYTRADRLRPSNVNASRHESPGIRLEPPSTNISNNYNANPDAALSNLQKTGDASSVLTREQASGLLQASGLTEICTSGYVICLDNTAGSTSAYVSPNAQTGNTNTWTGSAYVFLAEGVGDIALGFFGVPGPATSVTPNPARFIRVIHTEVAAATSSMYVRATAGQKVYLVLNQHEEQPFATSVIVTKGSATVRDKDTVDWALVSSLGQNIVNQAEGMSGLVFQPHTDETAYVNGSRAVLSINLAALNLMFFNVAANVFELRSTDGTVSATVAFPGNSLTPGAEYVLALRWGANLQVGVKTGGAWTWGTPQAYDGAFPIDDRLHLFPILDASNHSRELALWGVDGGTSALESFYSGAAN